MLDQIRAQLDRLVPVHRVSDLTDHGPIVERELALVKVAGIGEKRVEALRIAELFKAEVVDAGLDYFVFQIAHRSEKLDRFVELMEPLGMVDLCRTGVVALSRGPDGL